MRNSNEKSRMPPPLPCLIGLIAGFVLNWIWPWPITTYFYSFVIGLLFLVGVIVLSRMLSRTFKQHGTSEDPAKETTAIIESGPFRFSRNPAYLAAALLQIALGFLFNNFWIVLLTFPAVIFIHFIVVLREEAYLEHKFGDQYLKYKARVRPWI